MPHLKFVFWHKHVDNVLESGPGFDLHVINGRIVDNVFALSFFIPAEISRMSTLFIDSTNDSTK